MKTCVMKGVFTTSRNPDDVTIASYPECPCASGGGQQAWVQDWAHYDVNKVVAELFWSWNGAMVWNACPAPGHTEKAAWWNYLYPGYLYCFYNNASDYVQNELNAAYFSYGPGNFCELGESRAYYNTVWIRGGKNGQLDGGAVVDVESPEGCLNLSVGTKTVRY